jgi:hypothetical protein
MGNGEEATTNHLGIQQGYDQILQPLSKLLKKQGEAGNIVIASCWATMLGLLRR